MSDISSQERAQRIVRFLIWTYFILLIIEGALRKWVFPQLSNPLLVVRDPVALAIYFFSIRAGAFPKNAWFVSLVVIGILCTAFTCISLDRVPSAHSDHPYLRLRNSCRFLPSAADFRHGQSLAAGGRQEVWMVDAGADYPDHAADDCAVSGRSGREDQ